MSGGKEALRPRSAYSLLRPITTRWSDNDVYGHVNNVKYYEYFDSAVNAHLIEAGLLDIEKGALIGLVVETGCRYAAPLAYPQTVEAGIRVGRLGNSSVRYEVGIFAEQKTQAAAEGYFIHVYVDRETRRPAALPADWRAELQKLSVQE